MSTEIEYILRLQKMWYRKDWLYLNEINMAILNVERYIISKIAQDFGILNFLFRCRYLVYGFT